MTKYLLLVLVLLLGLTIVPAMADNLLVELDDAIVRRVETSCLIGNAGAAIGLYWPMATIKQLDVTIGPMGALGHEALLGGLGAQLPVNVTVMSFEFPIDFGFIAGAYNWMSKDIELCGGIGKTFDVEF